MRVKINIFKSEDEVLANLAAYFVTTVGRAITDRGRCSVALSGGTSPKKLYELLSSPTFKNEVQWQKVDFFFGDERNVPQTDLNSNYLMVKKALFEPLQIASTQVFAVDTTLEPEMAAEHYANTISNYCTGNPMRFDLVLLGLGDNSHTASLFPHTPVLHDHTASVKAVFLEDQQVYRITLTAPLINQARQVAFLVYGQGKAEAVHHVIEDNRDIENFPAQLIAPIDGELEWFIDEAAAAKLKKLP
jgi:6-phosphogluconolactonase